MKILNSTQIRTQICLKIKKKKNKTLLVSGENLASRLNNKLDEEPEGSALYICPGCKKMTDFTLDSPCSMKHEKFINNLLICSCIWNHCDMKLYILENKLESLSEKEAKKQYKNIDFKYTLKYFDLEQSDKLYFYNIPVRLMMDY